MELIRKLSELPPAARGGAVAIGNFDGVHRGHAKIVERLAERAGEVQGPAVVFTFDPHPVQLLRPQQTPPPLTWTERKAELLQGLGVDYMVAYPTDQELLALEPEEFFQRIVLDALQAKAMVEGPNFYFGHDRRGTIEVLRKLTGSAGIPLNVVAPQTYDGEYVSSSRIRQAIAQGRVDEACRMLTEPYRIRGMVTHGAKRGGQLGFPTANLDAIDTLRPAEGVYAGRAWMDNQPRPAAINIGTNPTFAETRQKVEVHIVGLNESIYGQPLEVDFLARLRDIQPFGSREALVEQLRRDVQQAVELVGKQ